MEQKSDLFVITKAKDLAKYVITITEKSPKKFRFTLVVRMQNYILEAIENLYSANSAPLGIERRKLQDKAKLQFSLLDYFAGIAYEQQCILFRQYEQISKQCAEAIMYLGKWIASDSRRLSK